MLTGIFCMQQPLLDNINRCRRQKNAFLLIPTLIDQISSFFSNLWWNEANTSNFLQSNSVLNWYDLNCIKNLQELVKILLNYLIIKWNVQTRQSRPSIPNRVGNKPCDGKMYLLYTCVCPDESFSSNHLTWLVLIDNLCGMNHIIVEMGRRL